MNDYGKKFYGSYSNDQLAKWRVKTRRQWLTSLRSSRGNRSRR